MVKILIILLHALIVFLAFVGVARRNGCLSSKEAEAKVIPYTIRRTKELEFHKVQIVLDAMEVVNAIKVVEDW